MKYTYKNTVTGKEVVFNMKKHKVGNLLIESGSPTICCISGSISIGDDFNGEYYEEKLREGLMELEDMIHRKKIISIDYLNPKWTTKAKSHKLRIEVHLKLKQEMNFKEICAYVEEKVIPLLYLCLSPQQ